LAPSGNLNGISVNMGIKGASVVGCNINVYVYVLFLDVVVWSGDLNARQRDCQLQVPAQLPGRVSRKGPPPYQQTSALPTKSVHWFVKLLKDQLSLHPIRFLVRHGV
jgi:hypothetical protein